MKDVIIQTITDAVIATAAGEDNQTFPSIDAPEQGGGPACLAETNRPSSQHHPSPSASLPSSLPYAFYLALLIIFLAPHIIYLPPSRKVDEVGDEEEEDVMKKTNREKEGKVGYNLLQRQRGVLQWSIRLAGCWCLLLQAIQMPMHQPTFFHGGFGGTHEALVHVGEDLLALFALSLVLLFKVIDIIDLFIIKAQGRGCHHSCVIGWQMHLLLLSLAWWLRYCFYPGLGLIIMEACLHALAHIIISLPQRITQLRVVRISLFLLIAGLVFIRLTLNTAWTGVLFWTRALLYLGDIYLLLGFLAIRLQYVSTMLRDLIPVQCVVGQKNNSKKMMMVKRQENQHYHDDHQHQFKPSPSSSSASASSLITSSMSYKYRQ